jgi:uncharacterized protein YdbL (DUF1318 family)
MDLSKPDASSSIGPANATVNRRNFVAAVAATTGALWMSGCSTWFERTPKQGLEVRKITPPKLETAYLGQQILCYRPMRRGSPNMSVGAAGDKLVAYNYGHGGSGWTLGPGCATYVVDLFAASEKGKGVAKDAPITVIGGGVLGLFTAYNLIQRGYSDVTITAASFDGLTSHNAGGLLAPVSMDNDSGMQALIDQIGIDAYKFYASVAKGEHKDFAKGASIVPSYFENRAQSGLEPYVGKVMQPAKDVVLDFGNGTKRTMVVYDDGIFIDTAVFMKELHDYLRPKAKFVEQKLNSYKEVASGVIFDCSGLGASKLNSDAEIVPVQGHLVMLKDQVPANLQYMILVYFDHAKTASNQDVKRSFYIFPKHLLGTPVNDVGVIGGTFIENATPDTPNIEEFQIMINNAKKFYGE